MYIALMMLRCSDETLANLIHKENTKEIMSMKESVCSDTEFC